jgi:hypothetical protein
VGDALHALSCAAGYNIRWLLRAIVRLGVGCLFCVLNFAGWCLGISLFRARLAVPDRHKLPRSGSASVTPWSTFVPAAAG